MVGPTGSGQVHLAAALNGLVPHFTGGHVEGRVVTGGRDPREVAPREFAGTVGVVGQDPLAGFVTDTVEEELAFGMEQLAIPPPVMRRRVEEILDALGIAPLRRRALRTLPGVSSSEWRSAPRSSRHPQVLVLDEPTSALDPAAAEEALAVVRRLVHDNGITVVAAEHRLERVVEYADGVILVDDHRVRDGAPAAMMRESSLAPAGVELGRTGRMGPAAALGARRPTAGPLPLRDGLEGVEPARGGGTKRTRGDDGRGLEARGVRRPLRSARRSCGRST